jgi:protein TonB
MTLWFCAVLLNSCASHTENQPAGSGSQSVQPATTSIAPNSPPSTTQSASGNRLHQCSSSHYGTSTDAAKTTGPTILALKVAIDGSVHDVAIAQSSGSAVLDEAAVKCAVEHWRFKPAMQNGKPVEASVKYAIRWQMTPPGR